MRRWRWILPPLLLVGAIGAWGNHRAPTGPAQGSLDVPAAAQTNGPTLRVAALNIQSGKNAAGVYALDATARALAGYDLAALNEVAGVDQIGELGRLTNAAALFAPTQHRWWHDDFGNGLLTRRPVPFWWRMPLAVENTDAARNVMFAEVEVGGTTVNVLIAHLARGPDHAATFRAVSRLFLSLRAPAILMGDLNAHPNDPELLQLLKEKGVADAAAGRIGAGGADRVMWVLVRGLDVRDAGLIDEGLSDHALAWAEVEPSVELRK